MDSTIRRTFISALVYGKQTARQTLRVRTHTLENGVIVSDGIEAVYLRFTAGEVARIGPARAASWVG
jgi:hypothetical protein